MNDLTQLYKQAILQHNREPVGFGRPARFTHSAEGLNAVCGDQVNVYLNVINDRIEAIAFDGESCAISMASASMMCAHLAGRNVADARACFDAFCRLMDKRGQIDSLPELGDVNVLAIVKKFPARIKSATLCWHAMAAALDGRAHATTE